MADYETAGYCRIADKVNTLLECFETDGGKA